jgi:hypothetical protein
MSAASDTPAKIPPETFLAAHRKEAASDPEPGSERENAPK